MVNFMCQLDWATGCPDIWSNMILSVSVRVYLDEIHIGIRRLRSRGLPPVWVGIVQSVEGLNRTKRLTLS